MQVEHAFLFNFAASYSQGGYKRLQEFARWFNAQGGASFVIHPKCAHLIDEFPRNRFFVISRSHWQRLYDDWSYLAEIGKVIGQPRLYYAYGIPLYRRFGEINWSHVQNVLIIREQDVPLSMPLRLKLRFLGRRFRRGFHNADVISAESRYSAQLLESAGYPNALVSVNGSDDELSSLRGEQPVRRENVATVVGTIRYKALDESLRVFESLQRTNAGLKLAVIGDPQLVPKAVARHPDVILRGILPRLQVIDCLRRSRFYISTTYVENSYNAASEGAYLADESFVSDIPPHAELLSGEQVEPFRAPGLGRTLLHVRRANLQGLNLKSWDAVMQEMLHRVQQDQPSRRAMPVPESPVAVRPLRKTSRAS
jgi:hypothetical protein